MDLDNKNKEEGKEKSTEENELLSFQAANIMPWKLFQDMDLMRSICFDKIVLPRHLQIAPTSACNLNCPFCSCKYRAKTVLPLSDLKAIVDMSVYLKVAGFTVTGDGEPLLHPKINEFLLYAIVHGIKIGLVTNGTKLRNLSAAVAPLLTWIRISFSDFREFDSAFTDQLQYLYEVGKGVDMAFSYVVSPQYCLEKIAQVVSYANSHNFTHVRLVADLYQTEKVNMNRVRTELNNLGIDVSRCIFQDRAEWTTGAKKCWISLLKPTIASDGYLYPCCGVQYALADGDKQRMFPPEMRMGRYTELPSIIQKQKHFDGSVCVKCYYDNYNSVLSNLLVTYHHREFV